MFSNPEKCIKLLIVMGIVQSTLGLSSKCGLSNAIVQIITTKIDLPGRPIHVVVTGDKYIGKSSIVNQMVRNKRFKQNITATKIAISPTVKVSSYSMTINNRGVAEIVGKLQAIKKCDLMINMLSFVLKNNFSIYHQISVQ